MPVEPELNKILKRMWAIDEALVKGEEISIEDREFYSQNLNIIKDYYSKNRDYWQSKSV